MLITERIKARAEVVGKSFASIERETGLANGSIRKWDTSSPSAEKLLKVALYLGVSIDWILTGEGEPVDNKIFTSPQPQLPENTLDKIESLIIEEYRAADRAKQKDILRVALSAPGRQPAAEPAQPESRSKEDNRE